MYSMSATDTPVCLVNFSITLNHKIISKIHMLSVKTSNTLPAERWMSTAVHCHYVAEMAEQVQQQLLLLHTPV